MTHKKWDREPDNITPSADDHVFVAARCIYCKVQELDVYTDLRDKCEERIGNNDVPKSWSFGPEGNDMADYEDERGRFYVDQYDPWANLQDYLDLTEQNIEDRPWRQC